MSKDISTLANDLNKRIEFEVSKTLRSTGEILKEEIQQEIDKTVYKAYDPTVYGRTHNLERSITKSPVRKDSTEIWIDVYANDNIAKSHHDYDPDQPLEPYADVVETGQGYDYGFKYAGVARPFMENVVDREKDAIQALIDKAVGDAIKKI